MKFYNTEDGKVLVIDKGERVAITSDKENFVFVENDNDKLFFKDMHNKNLSNSDKTLITYCDKWLSNYKKIYDIFDEIVSTNKAIKQGLSLVLDVKDYFDIDVWKPEIEFHLNIKRYDETIINGAYLKIYKEDIDLFNYIFTDIVDHYIKKNYDEDINVDLDLEKFVLTGNVTNRDIRMIPKAMANLSAASLDKNIQNQLRTLIISHNLDLNNKAVIEDLRNKVHSIDSIEKLEKDVSITTNNYEKVLSMQKRS